MDEVGSLRGSTATISAEKAVSGRRKFLKKAGKAAVTVPAVALLLSIESKEGKAQQVTSGGEPVALPPA